MPDPARSFFEQDPDAQPGSLETVLYYDLVRWREALARSIARNNLELRSDGIMTSVNRILFPLLLLRIAGEHALAESEPPGVFCTRGTVAEIQDLLAPFADALYAEDIPASSPATGHPAGSVIDERVLQKILDELSSPVCRYNLRTMPAAVLARALARYLTQTVRRSAAHQATVVDTHDTVLARGTVLLPDLLATYLVKEAIRSARKNRSAREVLPLRIFDPACGSGSVLLAVFHQLQEDAGGEALTFEERREILAQSLFGLDMNRHAVAAARLLLLVDLMSRQNAAFPSSGLWDTALSVLRDLRHTILCGNALISEDIRNDESWMFCPARDRHQLNPFSYPDRFPEIFQGGGFDAVTCNPPEGSIEDREWIQRYFQRRYVVYHPLVDRSAYFVERALSLVVPGGTVAMVMNSRFLRGAPGSQLRGLLAARKIGEIADLSDLPAGTPGEGLALLRVQATRPGRSFTAIRAGPGFIADPSGVAARHRFPVEQRDLDTGGWPLRDTRADALLTKIRGRGTPLEDIVMGQVHTGIRIADDNPFVVSAETAREWIRRDPRCKEFVRPVISARDAAMTSRFLIVIPTGWTRSHRNVEMKPWQWFRHRHPLIGRYLQQVSGQLKARAGPDTLWWESAWDEFWLEPRKKILFPQRSERPVFRPDAGRGIGDETMMAIPSSNLYLAGVLNSRLITFVLEHMAREPGKDRTISWDLLRGLPVYTPDPDQADDAARHNRMEQIVQKIIDRERILPHAQSDLERETIRKKILAADDSMNVLVYGLYDLTPEEIAVIEG